MNHTIDQKTDINSVASFIISLYDQYGDEDYIGEPVSQTEHMYQCALLAEQDGYDEEVVLAAFFHDIGHFCEHLMPVSQMDGFGVVDHEKLGADFLLSKGFSEKIASLVRNHVQAKRFLTFQDPAYYAQLSDASKKTLEFQGGRMTEAEAEAFKQDELFELHIKLRRWDERAKIDGLTQPLLQPFHDMMLRHLTNHSSIK